MSVFISYSSKDEAIYSVVRLALEKGGDIEVWETTKMRMGYSLADQLRTAIRESDVCIFIATRNSVQSSWCLSEVGAFWGWGTTILVFLADPGLTDTNLPPQFKGILMARSADELISAAKSAIESKALSTAKDVKGAKFSELPQGLSYYGPKKTFRKDGVFQNFQLVPKDRQGNVNAVQWMWADTSVSSYINAEIIKGKGILRINFFNAKGSDPCNIAIRGQAERPLTNEPFKKYLAFKGKTEEGKEQSSPVSVGVRLVNGDLQHWIYGLGPDKYIYAPMSISEWTPVLIDLKSENWHRFHSDGNPRGVDDPSFEFLCSVVLQLKLDNSSDGEGIGVVEFMPFLIVNDIDEYDKLLQYDN